MQNGGLRSFAAYSINGSYAQIVNFAKFGPFPDSGPSCRVRRKLGESIRLSDVGVPTKVCIELRRTRQLPQEFVVDDKKDSPLEK